MSAGAKATTRSCRIALLATPPPEMVDVVFELSATVLPEDYEWPLYEALVRHAPWLSESPYAGMHPIRGARSAGGILFVARRAKLALRMPRNRVCAASVLEGATLDIGSSSVKLGQGTFRRFDPAPTLYAARVVLGESGERAFSARVAAELESLAIARPFLCGRRADVRFEGATHPAFSVAVHDLADDESLRLQGAGLGAARAVGCGLFVPHKTILASA